jgi:hypothetical protein
MKSLEVCRQRNVLNTTKKQTASTNWKLNLRQARPLERGRSLQRQAEAHQPYRSREKDSTNASTHSLRMKQDKRKKDSDENGSE